MPLWMPNTDYAKMKSNDFGLRAQDLLDEFKAKISPPPPVKPFGEDLMAGFRAKLDSADPAMTQDAMAASDAAQPAPVTPEPAAAAPQQAPPEQQAQPQAPPEQPMQPMPSHVPTQQPAPATGVPTTADISNPTQGNGSPAMGLGDIYNIAMGQGLGEEGARVAAAIAQTEGGLTGIAGDSGLSFGPFQFYGNAANPGQLNNYAKQMGMSLQQAGEYVRQHPGDAAAWALQQGGYLGDTIRQGIAKGLAGADLATYAQTNGQVSVSPERAGQNYQALWAGGGTAASLPVAAVGDALGNAGQTIGTGLGNAGQAVGATLGDVGQTVLPPSGPAPQPAKPWGAGLLANFKASLDTAGQDVGGALGNAGQAIGGAAQDVGNTARTVPGVEAAGNLAGKATDLATWLPGREGDVAGGVLGTAGNVIGAAAGFAGNMVGEQINSAEQQVRRGPAYDQQLADIQASISPAQMDQIRQAWMAAGRPTTKISPPNATWAQEGRVPTDQEIVKTLAMNQTVGQGAQDIMALAIPLGMGGLGKAAAEVGSATRYYHGTGAAYDTVDISKLQPGRFGQGYYLTQDPEMASRVASGRLSSDPLSSPNVRPVDVPNNLQILGPLPNSLIGQGELGRIGQQLEDYWGTQTREWAEAGRRMWNARLERPEPITAKGLWQLLGDVTDGSQGANKFLAKAGYDGFTPTRDALVIFPESVQRLEPGGKAAAPLGKGLGVAMERHGDFEHFTGPDVQAVSDTLGIPIGSQGTVAVPYFSADKYVAELQSKGISVNPVSPTSAPAAPLGKAAAEADMQNALANNVRTQVADNTHVGPLLPKQQAALDQAGAPPIKPPVEPPAPPMGEVPPQPQGGGLSTVNNFEPVHVQSGDVVHGVGTGYSRADMVTPEAADRLDATLAKVRAESPVVDWAQTQADAKTYGADPQVVAALNNREGGLASTIQAIRMAQTDIEREIAATQEARAAGNLAPNAADAKIIDLAAQSVDLIGTINKGARESARALNSMKIELSYKDTEGAAAMWQARANQLENAQAIVKKAQGGNGKLAPGDAAELQRIVTQQEKQIGAAPKAGGNGTTTPRPPAPVDPAAQAGVMKQAKGDPRWQQYVQANRERATALENGDQARVAALDTELATLKTGLYDDLTKAITEKKAKAPQQFASVEEAQAFADTQIAAGIKALWSGEIKARTNPGAEYGAIQEQMAKQFRKDWEANIARQEKVTTGISKAVETGANTALAKEQVGQIGTLVKAMADSGDVRTYANDLLRALSYKTEEAYQQVKTFRTNYNKSQVRKILGANAPKAGSPEFQAVVQEFAKMDFTDPRAIARFASYMDKPGFWDHARAYRAASMLTGTATQLVNVFGNAIMTGYGPAYRLTAGAAETVATRGGRTRPRDAYASQAGAELAGFVSGFKPALKEAMQTWNTGISTRAIRDLGHSYSTQLPGPLKPLNVVFKGLGTADDFFRSLNRNMALMGEAERVARKTGGNKADIMANLVDHPEVFQRAATEAERRVLQADLGGIFKAIQMARGNPVVGTIIPFLQTNANIYKIGLADLGGYSAVAKTRAVGAAAKTGDARVLSDARAAAADARGEALIGSTIMTFTAAAAIAGNVSGAGPVDTQTRNELMATGWRPYSVHIGDTWWDYKRYLGPLFIPIAIAANAVEAAKYGGQPGDLKGGLATFGLDFGKMFYDQTGLKGLADFVDATANSLGGNPAAGWDKLAEGLSTSYVPAGGLLATFARAVDPNVKDPDGMLQAIYARIPGLSAQVPNKVDILGNVMKHDQPGVLSFFPFKGSPEVPSATLAEYARLRDLGYQMKVGAASGSIKGLPLTPKEQAEYQQLTGQSLDAAISEVVGYPEYQGLAPDKQARILTNLESKVRAQTSDAYLKQLVTNTPIAELEQRVAAMQENKVLSGQKP